MEDVSDRGKKKGLFNLIKKKKKSECYDLL